MLHGVRVRVSPSAPNLKKADFMSAFFMSEIYANDGLSCGLFVFFALVDIFLFLLSRKFVKLVRMMFLLMVN